MALASLSSALCIASIALWQSFSVWWPAALSESMLPIGNCTCDSRNSFSIFRPAFSTCSILFPMTLKSECSSGLTLFRFMEFANATRASFSATRPLVPTIVTVVVFSAGSTGGSISAALAIRFMMTFSKSSTLAVTGTVADSVPVTVAPGAIVGNGTEVLAKLSNADTVSVLSVAVLVLNAPVFLTCTMMLNDSPAAYVELSVSGGCNGATVGATVIETISSCTSNATVYSIAKPSDTESAELPDESNTSTVTMCGPSVAVSSSVKRPLNENSGEAG